MAILGCMSHDSISSPPYDHWQPTNIICNCYPYIDAARYQSSYFGAHPFPSSIYFNCFGNESVISNCPSTSLSSPCNSGYVAGVHCKGDVITGILTRAL